MLGRDQRRAGIEAHLRLADHQRVVVKALVVACVGDDEQIVRFQDAVSAERRLRLIPPGPFGPPERCVLPASTADPGLVIHPFGSGGRALYVPWSCGALVDRHGQANTSSFAADVLEHHARLEPVGGNLSPMVEVTLFERSDGRVQLLHLVNGSGAWTGTRPVPMREVEVVIPCAGEPVDVTGLVAGRTLDRHVADDRLTIRVPELDLFEAIRIDVADVRPDGLH